MSSHGHALEGEETLDARERLSERVALGVRCREGFDLDELTMRLDLDARALLEDGLEFLTECGCASAKRRARAAVAALAGHRRWHGRKAAARSVIRQIARPDEILTFRL